ncbi:MAG: 3-deoxy-manno-octulosonate cytidylyltransferase [Epsilonproteobacteria bacterium]|nr:3-deoxy-manno-octulosonate cytidylyltransferase [Campylobacterota bacterium]NPA56513.1 3-deoxy-manno-octulosonate cytidylyltransferase [Campylobacterota bacterium]
MIIIPARLASTRFPAKVLYEIDGIPMVIRTAMEAQKVDEVLIATDAQEVVETASRYGFRAVLTSREHRSGTERVNEAAAKLGLSDHEIIINVQADEPFIEPEVIEAVRELAISHRDDPTTMVTTAYKELPYRKGGDPNIVKVVTGQNGHALYFSRSPIPFDRDGREPLLKVHLGIYGYTRKMLERFCALAPSPLEEIESLEQLRALYHGYKIPLVRVESSSVGIDTLEDLIRLGLH